jgi:hypothetical protein
MGVSAAVFESAGKRTEHYVPGSYTRTQNVTSARGVSAGNLCIIGTSTGGKPDTLLEFNTLSAAKNTLVEGSLLEAIAYAFGGSSEYVPSKVYAMRVNKGTQASLTLGQLITIKSWDYGTHTNQLKLRIFDAANNSVKFVVSYKNETIESNEISSPRFSLVYGGAGTSSVDIQSDKIILTEVVEGETNSETIKFEDFSTIGTLVARINELGTYNATILNSSDDFECASLDTVTGESVTIDGVTFYSNFESLITALEDNIYIGDVEMLSNTRNCSALFKEGFEYFTGGTNGDNGSSEEWAEALEVLESEDIQIIATPSTDESIQVLISAHCTEMSSTVNRKERTAILGCPVGESDSNSISKAISFNSKYVSYVPDNASAINPISGKTETISGAMLGVMLAGMESAMPVNEPLTNKELNVLGFSVKRSIENMENLIKKGLLVCNIDPDDSSRFICIRGLTTYQGTGDLISCERSMVREDLFMNRDLRYKFKKSVGRPNITKIPTYKKTLIDAAAEWATAGYLIPNDSNENVWNITISIDGDKIYLEFSRYLTAPTNFIFATATNNVYTSRVEV